MKMTSASHKVTLAMQIQEVQRELGVRPAVYERRIEARKMKRSEAEWQTKAMEGVLATLLTLQKYHAAVKACIEAEIAKEAA